MIITQSQISKLFHRGSDEQIVIHTVWFTCIRYENRSSLLQPIIHFFCIQKRKRNTPLCVLPPYALLAYLLDPVNEIDSINLPRSSIPLSITRVLFILDSFDTVNQFIWLIYPVIGKPLHLCLNPPNPQITKRFPSSCHFNVRIWPS